MRDADDVTTIELKVAESTVGRLRMRASDRPDRHIAAAAGHDADRVRGRAGTRARARLRGGGDGFHAGGPRRPHRGSRRPGRARQGAWDRPWGGGQRGIIRAHPRNPTEEDWRRRLLALAARGARSISPGAIAAATADEAAEIAVLFPDADGEAGRRAVAAILRELESGLPGFAFAAGRSRRVEDPLELHRARNEALLAANVVEGEPERTELGYEETGTYQLLLPHMNDPVELRRFYDETVRPLVAYDEQYETDLLGTLSTFLGVRCQCQRHRAAADHPSPHGPVPVRARARADWARRVLHRRPREAVARAQGDARARDRAASRSGPRARRGGRTGASVGLRVRLCG